MTSITAFIKKHKKPLQIFFQIAILALTFFVVYEELRHIKLSELRALAQSLSSTQTFFIALAGVAAFSVNMVYDYLFAHFLHLRISTARTLEVGFVAQAFNGFVGFGGATGATLRARMYGDNGVPAKESVKIAFGISWLSLIGLFVIGFVSSIVVVYQDPILFRLILLIFVLAILLYFFGERWPIPALRSEFSPLQYLTHKNRILLLAASTVEWLSAGIFFAYTIRLYQADVGWILALLVFSIGTVVGFLSFIPGGLGTFEGASFLVFRSLGYSAPHLALSLLLVRLAYTILPWLFAVLVVGWEFLRGKMAKGHG